MYNFSCKPCSNQYKGSTDSFWSRFNNYRSAHRNFIKRNTVKQALFHPRFEDDKYHGISDWEITLIAQTESVDDLRRREPFWQYERNTLQPNWLNELDVALIFSGLTHYIYCSTLISIIILRVLIILLSTLIAIIIVVVIIIIITTVTITILFDLLNSFKIYLFMHLFVYIYLFIYLLIRGPIRPEGSPFCRIFNPRMLRVEGVS